MWRQVQRRSRGDRRRPSRLSTIIRTKTRARPSRTRAAPEHLPAAVKKPNSGHDYRPNSQERQIKHTLTYSQRPMRYELVLPRTRGLPDDTSRPSASLALDPGAHAQHFDLDPGIEGSRSRSSDVRSSGLAGVPPEVMTRQSTFSRQGVESTAGRARARRVPTTATPRPGDSPLSSRGEDLTRASPKDERVSLWEDAMWDAPI